MADNLNERGNRNADPHALLDLVADATMPEDIEMKDSQASAAATEAAVDAPAPAQSTLQREHPLSSRPLPPKP